MASDNFVDGLERVLELANRLNNEDPSLARFLGAVRIDVRRNPELRSLFKPATIRRERFIHDLVDIGVATGELDVDRSRAHRGARSGRCSSASSTPCRTTRPCTAPPIDAIKLLVEGKLIRS